MRHDRRAGAVDPDFEPIRVTENVISAWRWDAWQQAAGRVDRSALWISVVLGVAATLGAAAVGSELIPGDFRLSLLFYALLVGWAIQASVRPWIAARRLQAVLAEVRPEVVPRIVSHLDDEGLLRLVVHGGALLPGLSTRLAAERRDAAVALVAYVYDISETPDWDVGSADG